jgi:hypothetical protein
MVLSAGLIVCFRPLDPPSVGLRPRLRVSGFGFGRFDSIVISFGLDPRSWAPGSLSAFDLRIR